GAQAREGQRVRQVLDGAVAHHEVRAAGMPAAEPPGVLKDLDGGITTEAQRRVLAGRVVDVEPSIGDLAVNSRVHAGAPTPAERAGTHLLPGFADRDGAARAVLNPLQRRGPVRPKGADGRNGW